MSDTEFDIIVYGASGFTGRLVAEYMQQQYGRSVNWAMAGRSTKNWRKCAMKWALMRQRL